MFNGLKKTLKGVTGGLLMFGKRVFMAGLALLTAIVAPLIPLIIPMLKFAAVIGAVVAGLFILKKAFNWFKESWLGKKLGLDKESTDKAEVKDRKEGTGKYQSLDGEMDYGDTSSPKVIAEKPLRRRITRKR